MNKTKLYLISVFILCVFLACLSTDYDYDFFARLIVGERFIEEGILPFKDILSYSPTHIWFDHEWGSGVIFYLILKFFGAFGIVLFQALMMFGTTLFIVKTQRLQKHPYPVSITFLSVFLILFYTLNSSLVRCQLFSFFFFSVYLYLLEKYRQKGSNLIWLIPLITLFWNNVHGGVVSGLSLIFLYIIGSIFEKKPCKKYLLVLLSSLGILIINPYGIKYLSFLFSAVTMKRKYIVEWWSPLNSYHNGKYLFILFYILYSFIFTIYRNIKTKQIDYTKILILTATIIEGLMHVKMLSFAVISVSALCYNEILNMLKFSRKLLSKIEKSMVAVILIIGISIPLYSPQVPRATFDKFPLKETEFLKINNIKGNLLAPFGVSSYLSYALYPDNLIYLDGRYEEVYNDKEFMALKSYELADKNWMDIINNYPTEILMPFKHIAIYYVLLESNDWVQIYDGKYFCIFVKKNSPYAKQKMLAPNDDINYYRHSILKGNKWGRKLCQIL